jgi:MFS family permease
VSLFNKPDATATGLVVSLFTAGAFFGAGLAGAISDRLGRRATIAIGCLLFCIGGALQTGAMTISYLWGGRFIAGAG